MNAFIEQLARVDSMYGAACARWILAAEQAEAALYADHSYIRSRVPLAAARELNPGCTYENLSAPIQVTHPQIASIILGESVEPAENDIPHRPGNDPSSLFPWIRAEYHDGKSRYFEFENLTARIDAGDDMPHIELAYLAHLWELVYKGSRTMQTWIKSQRCRRVLLDLALKALPEDGTECFRLSA